MLQNIREKFTGWVALLILASIALSFVFVGRLNYNFISQNFAARVNGEDISLAQFENAYRDQLQANPQLAQLPPTIRQQFRGRVLEQLIQQRVIDDYLADAGYVIDNQQVTTAIQRTPEFQVDGKFDLETYRRRLAEAGYQPARFEQAQRTALRREQLQRAIRGSALLTPAEYRRYLNLAGEQRIVTLANISRETVADEINVTDEMIAAYYDDNPSLYQLPESADVEYVEISRSGVAENVEITDQEVDEYYEANKDRYLQDEQRQARHILIPFGDDEDAAKAQADDLLARIRAGESFEDLAREYSKDGGTAAQGGDLGSLTRTQLPDELGGVIFTMQEGDVEGPVKTDFGYHIVRLDKILARGPLPLDQVRGDLVAELQDQEAESLYRDLERKLSDALFDASDIRALAAAVGVDVRTVDGVTPQSAGPFGDNAAVIDAIFGVGVVTGEQLSEIVEIDSAHAAVFAVTRHNEATRQPLADVRDQVQEALEAQQAESLMAARAERMLEALEGGAEFFAAAESVGAEAQEPKIMARSAPDLDQSIAVAVFTALKPTQEHPTTGRTRNDEGGYTVFSLEAVIPGRPESIPQAERDSGKLQLTDQSGIGDFVAFVQALRENADVVINEDALAGQDLL